MIHRIRRLLLPASLALLATACGSGSGSGPDTAAEVSLVLTDAATDELSQFEVTVQNIVFTKRNGDTVSVLPRRTRVDFLELQALNELVAGTALEAGVYRAVALELDFQGAAVVIAGASTPATVRDAAGAPITGVVPVTIDFPAGAQPLVRPGRNNLFVFDLQLDQSVTVDVPGNAVTFTPVWTVELDPTNPKPIAANGVLHSVDLNTRTFVVERRAPDDTAIGQFTVATTGATVFQLDGTVSLGAPGVGNLVAHTGDRVFVQGTLRPQDRVLTAVAVESGAGVPGNGQDQVFGHVVARSGGAGGDATLTVLGRSYDVGTDTRRFNTLHTVSVSFANTKVLRRGAGNDLDTDAIQIGQLVWLFGDLTATTLDATAATGTARLLPTAIFGVCVGTPSGGTLTLDLVRFDARDVAAFDFAIGGVPQADPDAFTVDVTGLSTTGITNGSKLRVDGWLRGVGTAGADATARAIVDRSTTARLLRCEWSPATEGVLAANGATAIALDVAAASVRTVADGFGTVTLTSVPVPTIAPLAGAGIYSIVEDGAIEANLSFSQFRTSLLARQATTPVRRVTAFGTFDETSQAFAALTVTVLLQ
ncbi:MAG: DUF4382 domain-containing protein [Planctomycetes bacterium]|nr:DUF4382 domain-containing protein [Planctomycetota bacterium]